MNTVTAQTVDCPSGRCVRVLEQREPEEGSTSLPHSGGHDGLKGSTRALSPLEGGGPLPTEPTGNNTNENTL